MKWPWGVCLIYRREAELGDGGTTSALESGHTWVEAQRGRFAAEWSPTARQPPCSLVPTFGRAVMPALHTVRSPIMLKNVWWSQACSKYSDSSITGFCCRWKQQHVILILKPSLKRSFFSPRCLLYLWMDGCTMQRAGFREGWINRFEECPAVCCLGQDRQALHMSSLIKKGRYGHWASWSFATMHRTPDVFPSQGVSGPLFSVRTWLCKLGFFTTSLDKGQETQSWLCDHFGLQIQGGVCRGAGKEAARPWYGDLCPPKGYRQTQQDIYAGPPHNLQGRLAASGSWDSHPAASATRRRCSGHLPWTLISRRTASPVQQGPSTCLWMTPLGSQNPPDVLQEGTPGQGHNSEAALLFANVSGHQNIAWS